MESSSGFKHSLPSAFDAKAASNRSKSDVINPQGHGDGDLVRRQPRIFQVGARLHELAHLVEVGGPEPDIGREPARAVTERALHPGDKRVVLGGADPDGLCNGADVIAGPRPLPDIAALHLGRERIKHALDRLEAVGIRPIGRNGPSGQCYDQDPVN